MGWGESNQPHRPLRTCKLSRALRVPRRRQCLFTRLLRVFHPERSRLLFAEINNQPPASGRPPTAPLSSWGDQFRFSCALQIVAPARPRQASPILLRRCAHGGHGCVRFPHQSALLPRGLRGDPGDPATRGIVRAAAAPDPGRCGAGAVRAA